MTDPIQPPELRVGICIVAKGLEISQEAYANLENALTDAGLAVNQFDWYPDNPASEAQQRKLNTLVITAAKKQGSDITAYEAQVATHIQAKYGVDPAYLSQEEISQVIQAFIEQAQHQLDMGWRAERADQKQQWRAAQGQDQTTGEYNF